MDGRTDADAAGRCCRERTVQGCSPQTVVIGRPINGHIGGLSVAIVGLKSPYNQSSTESPKLLCYYPAAARTEAGAEAILKDPVPNRSSEECNGVQIL